MTDEELLLELEKRTANADTVVFDIGNTLMRFDPDAICDRLLPEEYRDRLRHAMFAPGHTWCWPCFDEGKHSQETIARNMVLEEGLPEACAAYVLYALNHFHDLKGALPLGKGVEDLHRRGKRILALTNYATPQIDYCWNTYPFFRFFEGRVVSSEEKIVKPDPEIYLRLVRRYGFDPHKALFIDDVKANTDAAAALGFQVWNGDFLGSSI